MRQHIDEIANDPALRAFGGMIAVGHALAFVYWQFEYPVAPLLGPDATPVCWPFFEECHRLRPVPAAIVQAVLLAYLALGGTAALALATRRVRTGWWALVAVAMLHLAILVTDYRLRLNQHAMLGWVTVVFLVAPRKRTALRALLVAFYVWAGLLKLNSEWLSGEALLGKLPLFVPPGWVPLACAYVVVLELVVVFGLIAPQPIVFWSALGQMVLFHIASWSVVGFFYPLLMLALLSIFVLSRVWPRPLVIEPSAALVVGLFSAFQLVPYCFPGDPALTGQGRAFALHMFDAPISCRAIATLRESNRTPIPMAMTSHLPARIACDPIVYFNFARAICRERAADARFLDLDLLLESRRGRAGKLVKVVDIERFCESGTTYDVLWPNAWIRGE